MHRTMISECSGDASIREDRVCSRIFGGLWRAGLAAILLAAALCVALALGAAMGCRKDRPAAASQPAANPEPGPISYEPGRDREGPVEVYSGPLSKRLRVRVQAETWDALVAKVKPDVTWSGTDRDGQDGVSRWNGPNMLWIEKDAKGRTVFHLEQAFAWRPRGQKTQWILIEDVSDQEGANDDGNNMEDSPVGDEPYEAMLTNQSLAARIAHGKPKDESFDGAGNAGEYAQDISRDPRGGVVCEVGWTPSPNRDGCEQWERTLYFWRKPIGPWRFIGEAPLTYQQSRNHGESASMEAKVCWLGAPPAPVIQFALSMSQGTVHGNSGETCQDYILKPNANGTPAESKPTDDHDYILAEDKDTLDSVVLWHCPWADNPQDPRTSTPPPKEAAERKYCTQVWREAMIRLNPGLARNAGPLGKGTHVRLPNEYMVDYAAGLRYDPASRVNAAAEVRVASREYIVAGRNFADAAQAAAAARVALRDIQKPLPVVVEPEVAYEQWLKLSDALDKAGIDKTTDRPAIAPAPAAATQP